MICFKDYSEFTKYILDKYNLKAPINKYKFKETEDGYTLFYETYHFIEMYKPSKNPIKRLLRIKDFDSDNSTFGYCLHPITMLENLCPLLDEVDIEYLDLITKQLVRARVKPNKIYHYNYI